MEKGKTNNPNGRPKGLPDKRTSQAREIAERMGFCPFEVLAHYAMRNHEALGLPEFTEKAVGKGDNVTIIQEYTISPELSQKSAKDAAEFVMPKLKAVEHSGEAATSMMASILSAISGNK